MINSAIIDIPRNERRRLLNAERKNRKRGDWGEWLSRSFPRGTVGPKNWPSEISLAYTNKVFTVLVRNLRNGITHLAVSSLSGERPTFHEMQRIKNELAGESALAVEIYPPQYELVDDADMFHIWVLPRPGAAIEECTIYTGGK